MTNSNRKCGEITYCTQVGKRVYVLNCIYCSQICLQWEMFINHLEQEHDSNLNLEPIVQPQTSKMPIKIEVPEIITDEPTITIVHHNKKQKVYDESLLTSAFDDPLESENSTSEMCLESSIKIEQEEECLPNLNLFETEENSSDRKMTENCGTNSQLPYKTVPINKPNTSQLTEILCLLRQLNERLTILDSKTDCLAAEITSIRNEDPSIRTQVYEDVSCIQHIIPIHPFVSMEQYLHFDNQIENEDTFKEFVKELSLSSEKSYDKFVRNSWKNIFLDELAEKFSWRGTNAKKCIRGARVTSAIRHAFKNKFALRDEYFDSVTQKHFQYAHDRLKKITNYRLNKRKLNDE